MVRAIMFSDEMVRAILEGRKTQTRRPIKPQPVLHSPIGIAGQQIETICESTDRWAVYIHTRSATWDVYGDIFRCPYGMAGDSLLVREGWAEADTPNIVTRITLAITNIKVERLWEISEIDAKAEGVMPSETVTMKDGSPCYTLPFQKLWTNIYGIDNFKSWEANPYVWVIEFVRSLPDDTPTP